MEKRSPNQIELFDRTWLLRARLAAKLSREAVAEACGISVSYYSKIENGIQLPNVRIGILIAKAVKADAEEFLREERLG